MERHNGQITELMDKIEKSIEDLKYQASGVRWFMEYGDYDESYRRALLLEQAAEKAVLLIRVFPAYTGRPSAAADVEEVIMQTVPITIGYTEEGWFSVRLPALLPKKSEGSADYYRSMLYPAMRRFFEGRPPIRFDDCVLIYRHVYDHERPERQRRDHDNIETNMITDIIALYMMPDDAPLVCSHYYCSAEASEDRTEVYVVPKEDFPAWLEKESSMPDEGVELLENRRTESQKDV